MFIDLFLSLNAVVGQPLLRNFPFHLTWKSAGNHLVISSFSSWFPAILSSYWGGGGAVPPDWPRFLRILYNYLRFLHVLAEIPQVVQAHRIIGYYARANKDILGHFRCRRRRPRRNSDGKIQTRIIAAFILIGARRWRNRLRLPDT